jgi:hypothetical protein
MQPAYAKPLALSIQIHQAWPGWQYLLMFIAIIEANLDEEDT